MEKHNYISKIYSKKEFISIVSKYNSMAQAAKELKLPYMSFIRYAKKLGCYRPNPSGKGLVKNKKTLKDITSNKVTIKTANLKTKLLKQNILKNVCDICGLKNKWKGKNITLELHHKDGNRKNNELANLQILCPNCHSQTDNYRNKKGSAI